MKITPQRRYVNARGRGLPTDANGLTLIEIVIGMAVLALGLLGIAGMVGTGYVNANAGGKTTMALTAARQVVEDMRALPFANLINLNGFDTTNPGTQPVNDPEREIARKWRYSLAGDGVGWNFTTAEMARWTILSTGGTVFAGSGQIAVVNQTATLRLVTVTVPIPGRAVNVQLATLISRM